MAQKVVQLVQIGEYSSTKHEFLFSENLSHFSHLESKILWKQPKKGPDLAQTWHLYGPEN